MLSLRSNHRPSLFWRTFILLCGLIFFSVVGWLQSFRVLSNFPTRRASRSTSSRPQT